MVTLAELGRANAALAALREADQVAFEQLPQFIRTAAKVIEPLLPYTPTRADAIEIAQALVEAGLLRPPLANNGPPPKQEPPS